MIAIRVKWLMLGVCITLAVTGGLYFGLYSCGGMVYDRPVFLGIRIVAGLIWMAAAITVYRSTPKSDRYPARFVTSLVLFLPAMYLIFLTVMAATAPFYPATPKSFQQWHSVFWQTFQTGSPC